MRHASPDDRDPIAATESAWVIGAIALTLLLLRLVAANFNAMTEGDEISIAAGVASLRNGNISELYRYAPQVGYYRLVAGLSALVGDDLLQIPNVMTTLSVLAGVVIPVAGLRAFHDMLSRNERRLLFAVLAANPIIWHSSRYGNTAMVSVALVVAAMAILSNRPRPLLEAAGLALFGLGILVRADAVLATGAVGVLLWRNHGTLRAAVVRVGALGLAVAAIFGAMLVLDPRMSALTREVGSHLVNAFETRFWDYLLWAMAPFPLLFAAIGLREMEPGRRWLLAVVAAWVVPPLLFYFGAVTSPRYFLLSVFPLSVAATVGISALVQLGGRWRPAVAAGVLAAGFLHLFIGLGYFVPSHRRSMLTEATFPTHDGPMWAGALLYKSYVMRRPWNAPLFAGQFRPNGTGELSLIEAFRQLASGRTREQRVLLVNDAPYGNTMHFYAQVAGVRATSCARSGVLFNKVCTMELGGTRITTIGTPQLRDYPEQLLPVEAGDELWIVQRDTVATPIVRERVPSGLALVPDAPFPKARNLWRFRVERAS